MVHVISFDGCRDAWVSRLSKVFATQPTQYCVGFGFRKGTYPPISWGAKNLLKSPNLAGDLGGSISGKLQNLRSIANQPIKINDINHQSYLYETYLSKAVIFI